MNIKNYFQKRTFWAFLIGLALGILVVWAFLLSNGYNREINTNTINNLRAPKEFQIKAPSSKVNTKAFPTPQGGKAFPTPQGGYQAFPTPQGG